MAHRMLFPFTAIVGQEQVKRALCIALVNRKAGGVLIAGEKGTAKSTLVRGLAESVPDTDLVEVPLNATEDMLFGSLDLQYAVMNGQRRFSPGLLARADGNLLYIDEINLLRRDLLTAILDTAASGVNVVEREGISYHHATCYTVIGTMNPEEGILPPQILDRFGLYASVGKENKIADRVAVMRHILEYERQPDLFCNQYREESNSLSRQIMQARTLLGKVEVSDAMIQLAASLCSQAHCAGHRAELFMLEAAKAIAALAERDYLLPTDIEEAALYILPHRMRQEQQTPPPPPEPPQDDQQESPPPDEDDQENPEPPPPEQQEGESRQEPPSQEQQEDQQPPDPSSRPDSPAEEKTADIDRNFPLMHMQLSLPQDRQVRRGSGKRSLTRTDIRQGRYVRAGFPHGPATDIAFDATLRAAAPYQRSRKGGKCRITVLPEDFRQKVREKRIGNTFLFVVDASGSMGARERMRAVKGAVFSLLQDAYQKRDQVGMIAFRRSTAEVLLPITRSVDLAEKCLQQLPTGGKTPLAEGLSTALAVLTTMRRKEKEMQPVLILVTDGRANSGKNGDAVADALQEAVKIRRTGVQSVVIDTETDFIKLGVARSVAREMAATYFSLQELSGTRILNIVKNSL
ncbi:MAG: VWA domain-containing protein [Veillonellales bacterium]